MDGDLIIREHTEQHYRTVFNRKTGFFVRKEEKGWPEPTWAIDGPELIDLSITNFCKRECTFCYRKANAANYHHLSLEDVCAVVEQASDCGTLQMALGGGNPNQHPDFVKILRLIREHGIVPSYTTNGDGLTEDILRATADCCGAMAVSVYPPFKEEYYLRLIEEIQSYGIKVNIHAIIRADYLELWTRWLLEPPTFLKASNAVVFLNYNPLGKNEERLIPKNRSAVEQFFKAANKCNAVRVGFDSCSITGIVRWMDIPNVLVEPCEAARFSAFISEDMKMYPCSFMVGNEKCGNLRKDSLREVWRNNVLFNQYRSDVLPERCSKCAFSDVCKGGCRLFDEINFC